ncbi:MAG: 3'(2'),5'-bisphosphate nucleotidase CysQ [Alphaproteobacteria bacterium]|nr:3'(2'),5'-bisphosphate nucleotidase CysQ [Alphaproteobacteria bacterium]
MVDDTALAAGIREAALAAGAAILKVYASDFRIAAKADASPVTAADEAAEAIILRHLARLTPGLPVVAEEAVAAGHVPEVSGGDFWLVDPLDGTREFISRNGEFTVNIALVRAGRPVLGVVLAPARELLYLATGPGRATREAQGEAPCTIAVRRQPDEGATVVLSRSHRSPETDAWLAGVNVARQVDAGSSLKLCLVAEGSADLYPRLGRTMEWDIAAGQAVLEAAGGSVTTLDGRPLRYGKPGFENPHFVARGGS